MTKEKHRADNIVELGWMGGERMWRPKTTEERMSEKEKKSARLYIIKDQLRTIKK